MCVCSGMLEGRTCSASARAIWSVRGGGSLPAERRGKAHLADEEVGTEGCSTSRETRCAYHLSAPWQGAGLVFGDEARRRLARR